MRPIIKAEGVGKQYRIGALTDTHATLRDALVGAVRSPLRWARRGGGEPFWALRDVGFEAQPGEVIGIIGRNGAGKSTLLKILSRVTEPTTGRIELYGRVSSLLEVGTGFHPELTGRENIFLNGAILGMGREEIRRKFDEIVAFAEIGQFLDTPVKRYSSGMYIRLAFAVAAHLDPEVLIIDEVLAVGDARFQRKCLDKMQHVGQQGRTVLFVSHNMPAVTRLCPRTILLAEGRVLCDGPSHEVVSAYLNSGAGTTAAREWGDIMRAPGNDIVRLCAVRVRAESGEVCDAIDIRCPVGIEMEFEVLKEGHVLVPNYHLVNEEGTLVFVTIEQGTRWQRKTRPVGHHVSTVWIPGNFLAEGTLVVSASVSTLDTMAIHFFERDAVAFQVIDSQKGDSARGDYGGAWPGVVRPLLNWTARFGVEVGEGTSPVVEEKVT